jgi:hypothetical protein
MAKYGINLACQGPKSSHEIKRDDGKKPIPAKLSKARRIHPVMIAILIASEKELPAIPIRSRKVATNVHGVKSRICHPGGVR